MRDKQFKNAENEYFRLMGMLEAKRITKEQFEQALRQLAVQDAQGRQWILGVDNGEWYVYDGINWVEANPYSTARLPSGSADLPGRKDLFQAPQLVGNRNLRIAIAGVGALACLLVALVIGAGFTSGILQIALLNVGTPSATSTFNTQIAAITLTPGSTSTFTPASTPNRTQTIASTPSRAPTSAPRSTVQTPATPATLYPTYTRIPQSNLQNPGVPVSPENLPRVDASVNQRVGKVGADAHRFQYHVHQREINVIIAQDGLFTPAQERERADFCFEAWTRAWEIFGGYAYSTYTCAISNRYLPDNSDINKCPRAAIGGLGISAYAPCGLADDRNWRETMQHEIFHAWNPGQRGTRMNLWGDEGITEYYSYLLVDPNNTLAKVWTLAMYYTNRIAAPALVAPVKPSTPQVAQTGECAPDIHKPLVSVVSDCNENVGYDKGALVTYMLDVEISERTNRTKSFDNVLRRLYLELQSMRQVKPSPTSASPTATATPVPRIPIACGTPCEQALLNAIIAEAGSSEFFTAFFKDYIEGTRDIYEWHDGLFTKTSSIYIPPHPPIK